MLIQYFKRSVFLFLLITAMFQANSQSCQTANWFTRASCISGNDPFITDGTWINNGIANIPPSKVLCGSYYWTSFALVDTICVPNNFIFEIRLKNPQSEGGISGFDTGIELTGSGGINTSCGLEGESWAQAWTSATAGTSKVSNNPALVMDLSDWHVIQLKYLNNVLHYSKDGTEFFQLPYTGNICNIEKINAGFKGSGSIDWMRLTDENGNELWREDFNSCSALVPFPECNSKPVTLNVSYVAPTCQNNELRLLASANQNVNYSWTGPNGFSSNLQNPVINNPTTQNQGQYTVTAIVNNCSNPVSQTVIVNNATLSPALVFSDDFSNPASTETKFSFYDPNNTKGAITAHTVTNNYLELRMDVTDANSWAVVNYDFASTSKIKITCDLYYHAGSSSNYYFPQINFSDYSTTNHKITGTYIQAKMQTDDYSPDNPCGDNVHPSLIYGVPATSTFSCLQNFNKKHSFASATSASFYDGWLNGATITLDKITGYVSVDIDGDGLIDMEGNVPSSLASQINTVSFSPYGWWTGHLMRIRNLKIYAESSAKTYSTINQTICEGQNYLGYTASGAFIDTLINAAGCDSIRSLHLTVIPKTTSTITQTICEGQNYLGYTASGTFIDTLVNAVGCDSIRTLHLTVKSKSYSTINQIICKGESYLGYAVSGTYVDTLLNRLGCDSIRILNLTVYPSPVVFAGRDTSLLAGNSLLLSSATVSGNIVSLLWTPDYNITDKTLLNPTITPLSSTTYILTATDVDGCKKSDSIKVAVKPIADVFIPNAFTPNSDGKNDLFKPIFYVVPVKYNFSVYNRYGQLVFETEDYIKGWDGSLTGIKQDTGAFVWIMKYTLQGSDEKIEKGTVVLIK